eukprot:5628830-Karenia_brevis.AAC.1
MRRDEAFQHYGHHKCQVEFVVDNQTVAGLANATLAAKNPFYQPCVRRIRGRLAKLYMKHCQYKAGFYDPVDWRPREWNIGADYLANCALQAQTDGGTLTTEVVRQCLQEKRALQFFTDGGFTNQGGAYAVQLVEQVYENGQATRQMLGHWYGFVEHAQSAFQMELLALDKSVELLWEAAR